MDLLEGAPSRTRRRAVSIPYGAIRWIYVGDVIFPRDTRICFNPLRGNPVDLPIALAGEYEVLVVVSIPYGAIRWIYGRKHRRKHLWNAGFNPLRGNPVDLRI